MAADKQNSHGYKYRTAMYSFSKAIPCIPGNDIHCIADSRPDYSNEWTFHAEAGFSAIRRAILTQIMATGNLVYTKTYCRLFAP